MTERLYREDQYIKEFRAKVLSCEKAKDRFEIILDRSAFYPEGGGQPGDRGFIGLSRVIDTAERGEDIVHICESPAEGEVSCAVDWDYRFLNMQQHTGEHIFSGILHSLTGFDNVGFHMGESEVTVDFSGPVSREILSETEKKSNEIIWKNVPVTEIYPAGDELGNYDYRSKKEISGQVRLIKIEGADLCACCGTHTAYTGEVGMIKAVSMMNYKQGVRITLKIGARALEDYREKTENAAKISASLCAKTGEIADSVEKLKEKTAAEHLKFIELKKKYFELMCEKLTPEFPVLFDDSGSADDARILADMIAGKFPVGYAFSGNDEDGYKYAVVSHSADVRETGKKINAALSGRGGGKPEMIMGSVNAPRNEIEKVFDEGL
jgi:alanyl-tRNA synthetase